MSAEARRSFMKLASADIRQKSDVGYFTVSYGPNGCFNGLYDDVAEVRMFNIRK